MAILTKPMKKYLLSTSKQGFTAEVQATYDRRIVEYAKRGIADLTLLAAHLPEAQLQDVLNHANLKDLIRTLFALPAAEDVALQERRRRLLPLCHEVIATLDSIDFAMRLAPEIWRVIVKEKGPLPGIRTVYYRSLVQE